MHRVLNVAEHNLFADPPRVITIPVTTPIEAFTSEVKKPTGEIAYRYLQNTGANPLWYSFGLSGPSPGNAPICDATVQYHGMLPANAQLDCSNHRMRVCVYSTLGTTVSTTLLRRRDLTK